MSAAEFELLLRKVIGERVIDLTLLTGACMVIGMGLAAWLGSYLAKKGEHLAISEDVKRLSDQARAMTSAVETIKTEISQGAWVAQRQWERKRELYTDCLHALYRLRVLYTSVRDIYLEQDSHPERASELFEEFKSTMAEHGSMHDEIIRAQAIADVLLTAEAAAILHGLTEEWNVGDGTLAQMQVRMDAVTNAHSALVALAKRDLEL